MDGLPPGWESDYDGRRWFYTYRHTGHVQYRFPCEGDEFPDFGDAAVPPPDLAPEERLESQHQLRRLAALGPPPVVPAGPRMCVTAAHPVSCVWEDAAAAADADADADAALDPVAGVVADEDPRPASPSTLATTRAASSPSPVDRGSGASKMPPPAPDPLGLVAELPTEQTPMSRVETHPEPVEMADTSVLAPIETTVALRALEIAELPGKTSPLEAKPPNAGSAPRHGPDRRLERHERLLPRQPAAEQGKGGHESQPVDSSKQSFQTGETGGTPAYLPYVPGPRDWAAAHLRPEGRRSSGSSLQRQVSLMMDSKPPDLDPSTVPPVLKPANGNGQPGRLGRDAGQPVAPVEARLPSRPGDDSAPKPQGQGTLPKTFPSVLKPARGKNPMPSYQRRSLPAKRTAPVPGPASGYSRPHKGVQHQFAPRNDASGRPASMSLAVMGKQPPPTGLQGQTGLPGRTPVQGLRPAGAQAYVPYRERPDGQDLRQAQQPPGQASGLPAIEDGQPTPPVQPPAWRQQVPRGHAYSQSASSAELASSLPQTGQSACQRMRDAQSPQPGRTQGAEANAASRQQQPSPASDTASNRGLRRHSAFTPREVSPVRSRSESTSSCHPMQTPSPFEASRRESSNPSVDQGVNNGTAYAPWPGNQNPRPSFQTATRDGVQKPFEEGIIPVQHGSDSYFSAPNPAPRTQSRLEEFPLLDSGAFTSRLQTPPEGYTAGLEVSSKGERRPSAPVRPAPHMYASDARQHRSSVHSAQALVSTTAGGGPLQQRANGQPAWQSAPGQAPPPWQQHPNWQMAGQPAQGAVASRRQAPPRGPGQAQGQPLATECRQPDQVYARQASLDVPMRPGLSSEQLGVGPAAPDKERKWAKWFRSSKSPSRLVEQQPREPSNRG